MVVNDGLRIDPERMVYRRQQLGGVDRLVDRGTRRFVARSVHVSALNTRARQDRRVTIGPVIATIVGIAVTTRAHASLGGAAEFADGDHERVLQQSSLIKIFDKRR